MVNEVNYNDALADVDALLAQLLPNGDTQPPSIVRQQYATLLGEFIEARLANMGWTADDLAERLQCETDLIQDILVGSLPESEISDELLSELAIAVEYDPNLLRILLGREITPHVATSTRSRPEHESGHSESLDYEERIEQLLEELTQVLFQGVEERFSVRKGSSKQPKQRDFLLRQIEMIIAKQRADVKLVQILIDELRTAELPSFDDDKNPHTFDIRRIIQYIKETR